MSFTADHTDELNLNLISLMSVFIVIYFLSPLISSTETHISAGPEWVGCMAKNSTHYETNVFKYFRNTEYVLGHECEL